MFGSEILDVAIGMALLFLLLSLVCSAIREAIEAFMRTRSMHLERGIRELLADPKGRGLAKAVYEHPLICGLYTGNYDPDKIRSNGYMPARLSLPSYIPSRNFALALIDIAARGPDSREMYAVDATTSLSLDTLRSSVVRIENAAVQRMMLLAIDSAQGDIAKVQKGLEAWFDSAMDRISGWYKRKTHKILFVLGFGVAVALNADALQVVQRLYADESVRAGAVAAADAMLSDSTAMTANIEKQIARLDSLHLPIGWDQAAFQRIDSFGAGVSVLMGWLITALALSLGAPFWFDLLNKFMVVRSTVKPHEKSPEEGSEDRQPKTPRPPDTTRALLVTPPAAGAPTATPPPVAATTAHTPAQATEGVLQDYENEWVSGDPRAGVL